MPGQHAPLARVRRLYVEVETRAASALESVVGSNAFGQLLATSASNAMALARLVNGGADRGVRALRVAGRADVASLARQLARTEDKLERMLQLVEELKDHLDERARPLADMAAARSTRPVAAGRDTVANQNTAPARTRTRPRASTKTTTVGARRS